MDVLIKPMEFSEAVAKVKNRIPGINGVRPWIVDFDGLRA